MLICLFYCQFTLESHTALVLWKGTANCMPPLTTIASSEVTVTESSHTWPKLIVNDAIERISHWECTGLIQVYEAFQLEALYY